MKNCDLIKMRPWRHMQQLLLNLFLIFVSISFTLAQQPSIDAPRADRLRAHISYLASEKLEGRRTGSIGANSAAEYIAREFARYGLRRSIGYDTPGMSIMEADSPRRYMQEFHYVAGVELGKRNSLFLNRGSEAESPHFMVGEDWMPLAFSTNAKLENLEVTFAGYGISSAELKYDDYAVSGAKDRVAVIFAGTPDGDNPHGQFARAGEIRFKAAAAPAAGARALVIIASEQSLKHDRLSRLSYDNAGEAGIPVLVVSRRVGAGILNARDGSLSDYEKIADARTGGSKGNSGSAPAHEGLLPNVTSAAVLRLPVKGLTLSISIDIVRRQAPAYNVAGILDGSDPVLKNETIVIGAHYDHLGRGGEDSLAPREGQVHHGADDNASGVAGMLELAHIFSSQQPRPKRTIIFIAFSGEEEGLLGSNFYVNHPIVPLANTVAMINMDMIGRLKNNTLMVGGVGTAQEWRSMLDRANLLKNPIVIGSTKGASSPPAVRAILSISGEPVAANNTKGQFLLALNEDGYGPSDHSSFYAKQIPVLFFWTGTHDDYHKPSDTAEKINYEGEAQVLQLVAHIVRDTAQSDKRPTFAVAKSESMGRSTGFRVYLGTIPNYADSNDGLKLDGVRDDSPAAKAGLKAGDRIVMLAGREVKNVYDYTYALGEMKAGQEYEVEVIRGNDRLSLKITPAARK